MQLINKQIFGFARVGFVGLGNMGFPMAANLAKNGHTVLGFDTDPTKASVCKENNVQFHSNITDVAKGAEVFVAMLPNSEHSMKVCQSDEGRSIIM